jgi:predicted PurR-regulated permease PerM
MSDLNGVDVARQDDSAGRIRPIAVLTSAVGNIERAVGPIRMLSLLALILILWWCQVVLIPIVLSIFISYALEPLVARVVRWHIPRALAVLIVMCTLIGAFGATGYALRGQAVAFVERIPSTVHMMSQTIRSVTRGEPGTLQRMQAAARELETATTGRRVNDGVTPVRVEEPTFRWSDWVWSGSRSAGEFAAQMFSVLCLTYYLLAAGDLYKRKLVRMVPTLSEKRVTVQILNDIDRQIERFLMARATISLIVGFVVWGSFLLLGVDDAGVWGVVSAVLVAIPIAGATVLVLAAGIAAFVQFGTLTMVVTVAGVCIVIGALEGNVLTPWLMSRVGEMNAAAVFVCLLFWGWIWGFWGLLLAVPITAAIKAVCDRVADLAPIAELLKE